MILAAYHFVVYYYVWRHIIVRRAATSILSPVATVAVSGFKLVVVSWNANSKISGRTKLRKNLVTVRRHFIGREYMSSCATFTTQRRKRASVRRIIFISPYEFTM